MGGVKETILVPFDAEIEVYLLNNRNKRSISQVAVSVSDSQIFKFYNRIKSEGKNSVLLNQRNDVMKR